MFFAPLLVGACAGDDGADSDKDAPPKDDSKPAAENLGYDLLASVTDLQQVLRLRLGPDARDADPDAVVVWTFHQSEIWGENPIKTHGLNLVDQTIYVGALDYFTEGVAYTLDVKTGALVEELYAPNNLKYGGEPTRTNTRATHNIIPWGDELISSDTHNNRVLGVSRAWEPRWEISTETLTDPYMSGLFSNPNDVELILRDGVEHLMVSARGDNFNHVMLFEPAVPERDGDPPWSLVFRYPEHNDTTLLHQNHNPRALADGSGFTVSDSGNNRILFITWDGEVTRQIPGPGCPAPKARAALDWPRDAVFTPEGTMLVADSHNDRVVEFDLSEDDCLDEEDVLWARSGLVETYNLVLLPHADGWAE
ncbi:MAG: hypothetical protein IPI35_12395 [Deltaproteobacteria bacterium]|nr:hypothetical protein [Deltaproteobacteria bacterium]